MPAKRVFTKEESDDIRQRYESGETIKSIADSYAAAQLIISRCLKEMGVHVGRSPKMTGEDIENIKKFFVDDGLTITEITARLPWSNKRISEALKSVGVKTELTVTEEEHRERLKDHGKVELVGKWFDTRTKTEYRCIEHGEIHPALPVNVAQGHGLQCCLVNQKRGESQRLLAKQSFDKKLAKRWGGKLKRVGEYVRSQTAILFECTVHDEVHLAQPANVLYFGGLVCCRNASAADRSEEKRLEAKGRYDAELALRGKVERVGEYITALTPVLHRCLVHNEVHFKTPNGCLQNRDNWGGLRCCKPKGGDSIGEAMACQGDFSVDVETYFYVFLMDNFSDHLKPGIAKDLEARADDEYGELEQAWLRSSRHEAFFVEQALLVDTLKWAHIPDELSEWAGRTELRKMELDLLIEKCEFFNQKMDELGRWEFALEFLMLPPALTRKCRSLLADERTLHQS